MTAARAEDVVAIQQRLAAATQAGDARKAEAYAACFTPDGVLELAEVHRGRAAIIAWMTAPSPFAAPQDGSPGYISHHLTTCKIDFVDEETASARTYWMVTSASGLDHNGYYADRLSRIEGEWLIAHRRPRTLWISPVSVIRR
ncbi:hypothetical protein B2G71_00875 [Novosphingobium sp. PC22D]|uniref:nuclear transport factor 2 family protein n=1 Tax=Novosphingobium sp. PC22D TaxID=1962403 RepID=UPI000BF08BB2|nr:nuclear transport factor 2 family protein [Novosphingobium sp. PC22D]PEQ14196.1 hypothetical protein B2G71_00875 [Novosphingobium sp. PC22D]